MNEEYEGVGRNERLQRRRQGADRAAQKDKLRMGMDWNEDEHAQKDNSQCEPQRGRQQRRKRDKRMAGLTAACCRGVEGL
ncbi:hypothetical protein WR25_26324 [Diploscapter pachys]|nr:hypothetical protein WR25_26324 [Diploscapter pachys]